MSLKAITIGAALLSWAVPAAAQERGTVEFGAFASAGRFDKSLTLDKAFGGGGRVGIFLDPMWAIEFEHGEMKGTRTNGQKDVNVGILSARLVVTPIQSGAVSVFLGAGAGSSTETNFLHSYGVNALAGVKFALSDHAALRFDVTSDFLANYDYKSYQTLRAGISLFRSPTPKVKIVEVQLPAPPAIVRPDSVSAEEQARLRKAEMDYKTLRDSLGRMPTGTDAASVAKLQEMIHFATARSDITPEAKATLDAKLPIFRANEKMRIIIVGGTDDRGGVNYNMALGMRRSAAAKAYLVSQGIDASRIEITSVGKGSPIEAGRSMSARAMNRRDEFRLMIGSDVLVAPKP